MISTFYGLGHREPTIALVYRFVHLSSALPCRAKRWSQRVFYDLKSDLPTWPSVQPKRTRYQNQFPSLEWDSDSINNPLELDPRLLA